MGLIIVILSTIIVVISCASSSTSTMLLAKLLCLLTTHAVASYGANILGIFQMPYHSHQLMGQALMKDLAARGHHLTILTTHLFDYKNTNVTQIHFNETAKIYSGIVNQLEYKKSSNIIKQLWTEGKVYKVLMEDQLKHPEVQKLITEPERFTFDVVVIEAFTVWPTMAFAEIFKCPIIVLSSIVTPFPLLKLLGNDVNPAIHPESSFLPYIHGELTLRERLTSFMSQQLYYFLLKHHNEYENRKLLRKFFPQHSITHKQLEDRIALIFTNSLTTIRPLVPNTIPLSFMQVNPPKAMPDGEVKAFLDDSTNGVILMSLGSYAKSQDLDSKVIETFLNVFKDISYDVLWKFEGELHNKSDNVMIAKWLPQADVLAHPKLKLFITHGGLNSVQESIDREVPMVVLPLTYDQPANANEMVHKGVARRLDLNTLNEIVLRDAISEMMRPKYQQNIIKLRHELQDRPMTSRELAVWYTEHVIRHKGAKHLEYIGRNVPLYQRHHYDIILLASTIAYLTFKATKSVLRNRFSPIRSMKLLLAKKNA